LKWLHQIFIFFDFLFYGNSQQGHDANFCLINKKNPARL